MPDLKRIKEVKDDFRELFTRFDDDRKLALLDPYVMRTLDGNNNAEDVANVTLAGPKLYLAKYKARVGAVERQPVIESLGKMTDKQTADIEYFLQDMEYEIDAFLNEKGEMPEFITQVEYAGIRGHLATQVALSVEDDTLVPDVRPIDCRYYVYEYGKRELNWAAPFFERPKRWIEEEYPLAKPVSKNAEVIPLWTPEEEIVYVGDKEVKKKKNKYGYVPFVNQLVATGSVLKDKGYMKHTGESIFEVVRTMFPEMNFIATILKTKNYGLIKPALTRKSLKGERAPKPKGYPSPSTITNVDIGGGFEIIPEYDMRNYTRVFRGMIDSLIQMATFSTLDFGTITFPLAAVAMTQLMTGRNEILLPRLQALALLWQARSRMIIKQFRALNRELKIGREGHKRTYNPDMLDGEYVIKYRYFTTSKEEQAANAALANAMEPYVSEEYIAKEIFKLPDPHAVRMQRKSEMAVAMSPVLTKYEQLKALIEKGEDAAAKIVFAEFKVMVKQMIAPPPPEPQKQAAQPTEEMLRDERRNQEEQMMPLFSRGNAGGGVANRQIEQGAIIPEGEEGE